ncbi:hypothetical protein SAMN05421819_1878 [Bryocella elongata]|uniref:Uncharacterized protein n=1 Tax=Bryocella elongata TaxID=863522 RepID=A0A1H5XLR0_9BACT|nr:hypothetical protein SAMN05421819_1878 [Bryocella elongata]
MFPRANAAEMSRRKICTFRRGSADSPRGSLYSQAKASRFQTSAKPEPPPTLVTCFSKV